MDLLVNAILLVLFLAVLALGWVRLAPLPTKRFSARPGPNEPGEHKLKGGVKHVIPLSNLPEGALDHFAWVALEAPRSRLRFQSGDQIAIVTRTRRLGLPDVTVAWVADNALHIHAHLVYGRSDFGSNAARIDYWLDRLRNLDEELEDEFDQTY